MHRRNHDLEIVPRRILLGSVGATLLVGCAKASRVPTVEGPAGGERQPVAGEDEQVGANEDLMREHGVLERVLLVYEAQQRRLTSGGDFEPAILHRAARLVQRFIGDYHEKLEEEHVFARFERAGRHVELVGTLRAQHEAGRRLTAALIEGTMPTATIDARALTLAIGAFVQMYRPHAAREDTVLFPALRKLVSTSTLAELGEQFEHIEHARFGEAGFDGIVAEVDSLEKELGIHDLSQFTPA